MKTFIAILLLGSLLGLDLASDSEQGMSKITQECAEDLKVEIKEVRDLMSNRKPLDEASQTVKCTARCILERGGYMDPATSKFLPDAVRTIDPKEPNLEQALQTCESLDDSDPCDKAYAISVCMLQNLGTLRSV